MTIDRQKTNETTKRLTYAQFRRLEEAPQCVQSVRDTIWFHYITIRRSDGGYNYEAHLSAECARVMDINRRHIAQLLGPEDTPLDDVYDVVLTGRIMQADPSLRPHWAALSRVLDRAARLASIDPAWEPVAEEFLYQYARLVEDMLRNHNN